MILSKVLRRDLNAHDMFYLKHLEMLQLLFGFMNLEML